MIYYAIKLTYQMHCLVDKYLLVHPIHIQGMRFASYVAYITENTIYNLLFYFTGYMQDSRKDYIINAMNCLNLCKHVT